MLRPSFQHAATPAQLVRRVGELRMTARAQYSHDHSPKWRPMSVLDEWVAKEARPISLRQLMVFGRSLTEPRLISSANYVRTELPTRIAHRIRDMQVLPYKVVTNRHMNEVYDLYYTAFDTFRKVREIKSLEDNDRFCKTIRQMLKAHLTVIPKLAMGVLECNDMMDASELDKFMNTVLRSRISRRVIAEQHLALTDTFHARFSPGAKRPGAEFIGEVFLKCVAKDVVERCGATIREIAQRAYGPDVILPEIRIDGHLDANFPYILSHLEYIIGELLRNSVQAVVEKHQRSKDAGEDTPLHPPPIEVTICESQQHVIIRICDRGGGIPREKLPYLWSFTKGPASDKILTNLGKVPKMAATLQELREEGHQHKYTLTGEKQSGRTSSTSSTSSSGSGSSSISGKKKDGEDGIGTDVNSSLASLTSRPPNLRLGMGLPLSRVYAEYWAGSLALHSLAGYGVDAFLQVSKLGNKNEQLTTRASMDAV
ncbi:putative protein kinase YGL059W [Madurella fahalii]|uniref:Protein-serine/threonine kinase n=1 Tax=Madurella fahalii TaxID=1157608 RepID=A0ABQ0GB15_9PEZI